ncbi:hypothetical protein LAT59_00700 [Candidatus Gracilibacteria bacterium]|nr:hypothetical protein [Candidatus Gracilibacteria bacterium]
MIQKIFLLSGLIFLLSTLSACSGHLSTELLEDIKINQEWHKLENIISELEKEDKHNWQGLHNLGYLHYILWTQKREDISGLILSYEYFKKSYEVGEDMRTKHNIDIIEKLLAEYREEENTEQNDVTPGDYSESDEEQEDSSGESQEDEQGENGEGQNTSQTETGNSEGEDELGQHSIPIFQELGYNSEEELLKELERYTHEILDTQRQYQHHLRQQYQENISDFDGFFGRGNPFFQDMREQGEKDW